MPQMSHKVSGRRMYYLRVRWSSNIARRKIAYQYLIAPSWDLFYLKYFIEHIELRVYYVQIAIMQQWYLYVS